MKIQINNLTAQMQNKKLNIYQKADALNEFNKLINYVHNLEQIINEQQINTTVFEQNGSKALYMNDAKNSLFNKEINRLALEKYPIKMVSAGDDLKEWDINEQYRECWIDGYMVAIENEKINLK